MAILPLITLVATAVGTYVSARGTIAAGKQAQAAADYEAAQLDIRAKEERAAARFEAEEKKRTKELALSELTSKSAASGFTATDPSTLALADEIYKYGTLQEQMAMYGGESRGTGAEAQAEGRLFEGRAARSASKTSALATILGGISTMAGRYGQSTGTAASGGYRYG
jgi:hypothetical protein